MNTSYYLFIFIYLIIFCLVLNLILNIIATKKKKEKINIIHFNITLIVSAIAVIYQILIKGNEVMVNPDSLNIFIGKISIYLLPYILVILIIYAIKNIFRFMKKKERIHTPVITSIFVVVAILIVYYLPTKNLIKVSPEKLHVDSIEIDNKYNMDMLQEVINKHTFIRTNKPFTNRSFIIEKYSLYLFGKPNGKDYLYSIQIYDDPNKTILYVNNHPYKSINQKEFTRDILNILKELET